MFPAHLRGRPAAQVIGGVGKFYAALAALSG